jgi:hypothetical protein
MAAAIFTVSIAVDPREAVADISEQAAEDTPAAFPAREAREAVVARIEVQDHSEDRDRFPQPPTALLDLRGEPSAARTGRQVDIRVRDFRQGALLLLAPVWETHRGLPFRSARTARRVSSGESEVGRQEAVRSLEMRRPAVQIFRTTRIDLRAPSETLAAWPPPALRRWIAELHRVVVLRLTRIGLAGA